MKNWGIDLFHLSTSSVLRATLLVVLTIEGKKKKTPLFLLFGNFYFMYSANSFCFFRSLSSSTCYVYARFSILPDLFEGRKKKLCKKIFWKHFTHKKRVIKLFLCLINNFFFDRFFLVFLSFSAYLLLIFIHQLYVKILQKENWGFSRLFQEEIFFTLLYFYFFFFVL